MSILSTLADPGSAVIVTSILGYVAHRLGTLKIGNATLAADVAKDWPAVKAVADKVPALEAQLTSTAVTANAVDLVASGIPAAIEAAVHAEFARLFPQLMATPVAPAATPAV